MENKKSGKKLWVIVAVLLGMPLILFGLLYADDRLASAQRNYCVGRSLLLLKLPKNPFTTSKSYNGSAESVYKCASYVQPAEPDAKYQSDVASNYKYTINLNKLLQQKKSGAEGLADVSEKYLLDNGNPWNYKLEDVREISGLFGDCGQQKCMVAKFRVFRKNADLEDAYIHYLVLVKNRDGQYGSTAESFYSISPVKGI
jgi:hypothetical protein